MNETSKIFVDDRIDAIHTLFYIPLPKDKYDEFRKLIMDVYNRGYVDGFGDGSKIYEKENYAN